MKLLSRVLRCSAWPVLLVIPVFLLAPALQSCGGDNKSLNENLLENPSFEKVDDGIPKHWTLTNFMGTQGQQEAQYGIDKTTVHDGQNSWYFKGDPGTRKWFALTQEVEIPDTRYIRLRGWMQTDNVRRAGEQHLQCNFLVTFLDENRNRFQAYRFYDRRTEFVRGTNPWFEVEDVFRVPKRARYVGVSCVLGCDGKVWFDDVELTPTQPLDWESQRTKNFVFYWLPERSFPAGSIENEQRLFDNFATRLGLESDVVVDYYLYPDTATFQDVMRSKGYQRVDYDDKEIHTINPNDDHEIIHMMTDEYGKAPRMIAEGTVFWLHGEWRGKPVDELAADLLAAGDLPTVIELTHFDHFDVIGARRAIPAAASFVGFIVERWGTERLIELYKTVPASDSHEAFSRAFERVYGVPRSEVEEQWHRALSQRKKEEPSERD
jgi:hypothetical protein